MVDLIRSSTAEPGVRPVEVVPREVERQLLFESSETERDHAQASSPFVLDSSNPALNHRQAPILPQSTELNPMAMTPSSEPSRGELNALVRKESRDNGLTDGLTH
jgi:hypothetical protein